MHSFKTRPLASAGPLAAALLALLPAATHAQVQYYATFKDAVYQQTGPAVPTAPSSYFFASQTVVTDPNNDASSATVTPPGGTAHNATLSGNDFGVASPGYATKAELDAAYPNGTYTFTVDGGTNGYTPDSGQLTISQDMYPSAIPAFTPGTVAALSSYDPAGDLTFNFNSFTQDPNTNTAGTYFSIYDSSTGMTVFSSNALPTTATTATVPGGTLAPFHAYVAQLDFDNRLQTLGAGFPLSGGATSAVANDNFTELNFTTAPEPPAFAGFTLGALGLAGLGWRACRRAAL